MNFRHREIHEHLRAMYRGHGYREQVLKFPRHNCYGYDCDDDGYDDDDDDGGMILEHSIHYHCDIFPRHDSRLRYMSRPHENVN